MLSVVKRRAHGNCDNPSIYNRLNGIKLVNYSADNNYRFLVCAVVNWAVKRRDR